MKIIKNFILFTLIIIFNEGYCYDLPISFVCEYECSSPGLNQLNIQDGEFRIYASLTPKRKIFAKGDYLIDNETIVFRESGTSISFNIKKETFERNGKTLNVFRLIWLSGTNNYFKPGIIFVETVPVLYWVPTRCMIDLNLNKNDKACKME